MLGVEQEMREVEQCEFPIKQDFSQPVLVKNEDINPYRSFEAFALDKIPENLIKVNVSIEMSKDNQIGPLSFWRLFYYDLHLSVA